MTETLRAIAKAMPALMRSEKVIFKTIKEGYKFSKSEKVLRKMTKNIHKLGCSGFSKTEET